MVLTLLVASFVLAEGHGAKGDNIYEFQLEFLEPVEPKVRIFSFFVVSFSKEKSCHYVV